VAVLNYCTVGSNEPAKAKEFFDALLASVGYKTMFDHPSGGRFYGDGTSMFAVLRPHDGNPATVGNGTMIAFAFPTREEVDAFHAKALSLGGKNEGDPGERGPGIYFAYFRDLDGNKFAAYKWG
jgi:catechol 2,3-dioxygenase-like lactoylglutathione lyase family enzyme